MDYLRTNERQSIGITISSLSEPKGSGELKIHCIHTTSYTIS